MDNLKDKAVLGLKWTTVGTIGRSAFQLLQIVILTRFLPKEAFGLVAMAVFVVQFTNIFADMGMTSAILHKQDATKKEYSSVYWLNVFISLILYLIVFFSTSLISVFYKEPELNSLVPILGTNILLMAMGRQHRTIMQRQFEFKAISIIELISYGLGLISAVLLAIKDYGVYSLVYSTLFSSLVSNVLFLLKNLQKNPISFYFKLSETKSFLKIGGFTMGSTLLDFFSREIDVLIIGKLLGADSLGVYSLAKQIVLKLYSIVNPIIINVLSPLMSAMQSDNQRLKKTYLRTVNYLAYINAPVYLFIIIAAKEILSIMYGVSYVNYYLVLALMSASYFFVSIGNPVGSLQIATGRTDLGFKWTIFRILLTIPVVFLGALISINAVALAYLLLNLLFIVPSWFMQLKPMAGITLKEILLQYYKPLLLNILFLIIIFVFKGIRFTNIALVGLIIKGLLTIIIYFMLFYVFDKKLMKEIFSLIKEYVNLKKF